MAPLQMTCNAKAETLEELGTRFFPLLLTEAEALGERPYLKERTGLMDSIALSQRKDWAGALTSFRDYYLEKLANAPTLLGYPPDLADPSKDYNKAFGAVVQEDPKIRAATVNRAEQLLARQIVFKGENVEKNLWSGAFATPLLQAYVYKKDDRYLRRWCDLMDEWSLEEHYLENLRPL